MIKNNFLKQQIRISKSRTHPFIPHLNSPDCHGNTESPTSAYTKDMTSLHNIPKQPQAAQEPLGPSLSERTRLQLGHKPKSSFVVPGFGFVVVVVVIVQMDNLSRCFSYLRQHENHQEVLSKHGLLGPPPKFLFQ